MCNSTVGFGAIRPYSQVHDKRGGGQIKRGDFKDFEKLLNGGDKINGEVGTKYKREETKL